MGICELARHAGIRRGDDTLPENISLLELAANPPLVGEEFALTK
jgi:hypothetical protein